MLVTGGAGFLGSHLIDRLLERGDEVLCVDNLFTGDKSNLDHLSGHARFEFMRHDVGFPLYVEVDQIFNLACPASPIHYQHDPVATTKTSVIGAINMLGLAKRLKVPIKVARIFNTYGPRMHPADGRVVSNFIMQALRNEPITIYGDGSQTRSFCYVDDLIRGLMALMDTGPGVTGPINIGNPNEFTVRELAEKVIELTASSSRIIQEPLPQDDPKQRQPNIAKAKEVLGWQPAVELEQGLGETIEYFRKFA